LAKQKFWKELAPVGRFCKRKIFGIVDERAKSEMKWLKSILKTIQIVFLRKYFEIQSPGGKMGKIDNFEDPGFWKRFW
jgi:hypothetical protein